MKKAACCRLRKMQLLTSTCRKMQDGRRRPVEKSIGHENCRWRWPLLFSRSTSNRLLFSTWSPLVACWLFRRPFYSIFYHALDLLTTLMFGWFKIYGIPNGPVAWENSGKIHKKIRDGTGLLGTTWEKFWMVLKWKGSGITGNPECDGNLDHLATRASSYIVKFIVTAVHKTLRRRSLPWWVEFSLP